METGSPTEIEKEAARRQAKQQQKEGAGQRPTKKDREQDGGAVKHLQRAA